MTAFSQSKDLYKVFFNTKHKYLDLWDELLIEDAISIAFYEIESKTIDAEPDDVWCYEIYLSRKPQYSLLKQQILNFARDNDIAVINNFIEIIKVEDIDWVAFYQGQLKPIEIGRFFVGSKIHKDLCPEDKHGIFIESSRAFGTGQHETTAGCVQALELLLPKQFGAILDIGTGTGILAFASEVLWPQAKILACDIEAISIEIAKDNAGFNNSRVTFYQNTVEDIIIPYQTEVKFNLIISNILARPLIELSSKIKLLAAPGCYVVLAGFLDYQQEEIVSAYQKIGFILKHSINNNSWIILILQLAKV